MPSITRTQCAAGMRSFASRLFDRLNQNIKPAGWLLSCYDFFGLSPLRKHAFAGATIPNGLRRSADRR